MRITVRGEPLPIPFYMTLYLFLPHILQVKKPNQTMWLVILAMGTRNNCRTFCLWVLRSQMNTPPGLGSSPLRNELVLPTAPGLLNWVISLVVTREEGRPGEVRLLVRWLPANEWGCEEELDAAANANVEADGPQAIDKILDKGGIMVDNKNYSLPDKSALAYKITLVPAIS